MLLVIHLVGWFVAMVVLMSIIEHQVHSGLMHRKPRSFLTRGLRARWRIFTSHAIEHHRQYRGSFHDDPVPHGEDRGIRLCVWEGIVESLLNRGATGMVTTHDLALASALADDVWCIAGGGTRAFGPAAQVLAPEQASALLGVTVSAAPGSRGPISVADYGAILR